MRLCFGMGMVSEGGRGKGALAVDCLSLVVYWVGGGFYVDYICRRVASSCFVRRSYFAIPVGKWGGFVFASGCVTEVASLL